MNLLKMLLAALGVAVATYFALPPVMAQHDQQTRRELLAVVARELPVGASVSEMTKFMQRHTTRSDIDDRFHHEYAGFVTQSEMDKLLFDRKVRIALKMDSNRNFSSADVQVFYTFI